MSRRRRLSSKARRAEVFCHARGVAEHRFQSGAVMPAPARRLHHVQILRSDRTIARRAAPTRRARAGFPLPQPPRPVPRGRGEHARIKGFVCARDLPRLRRSRLQKPARPLHGWGRAGSQHGGLQGPAPCGWRVADCARVGSMPGTATTRRVLGRHPRSRCDTSHPAKDNPSEINMDSETSNQISSEIADLRARVTALRGYL